MIPTMFAVTDYHPSDLPFTCLLAVMGNFRLQQATMGKKLGLFQWRQIFNWYRSLF